MIIIILLFNIASIHKILINYCTESLDCHSEKYINGCKTQLIICNLKQDNFYGVSVPLSILKHLLNP